MVDVREFTVDLRKGYLQPRPGRANKAVNRIRLKISKALHVPTESIKISNSVNEHIWAHGRTKPPHKIKLALKQSDEITEAYLFTEMEDIKKSIADEKAAKQKKDKKGKKEKEDKQAKALPAGKTKEEKPGKEAEDDETKKLKKQEEKKEIEKAAQSFERK